MSRKHIFLISLVLLLPCLESTVFGQAVISTFAGSFVPAAGTPSTSYAIGPLASVVLDGAGGYYFLSLGHNRVYRVTSPGTIEFVTGGATMDRFGQGEGDGGPARLGTFNLAFDIALDASGNLYIADYGAHRVRKVSTDGRINTFAGDGVPYFKGDGGSALQASLFKPSGLAIDAAGNLYIADTDNNRVRRVGGDGVITTVAGTSTAGYSGDGGPATMARLNNPTKVSVDTAGNLYINDSGNNRIRRVGPDGVITTVAGNGTNGYAGDGGPATAARIDASAIALDARGNLYIAEPRNQRIRMVTPDGNIETVAGNGSPGFADGVNAADAVLNGPAGIAVDTSGALYIAETENRRVRKVSVDRRIETSAGNGACGPTVFAITCNDLSHSLGDGGAATLAQIKQPEGIAIDKSGNVYVADHGNYKVRKVSTDGTISTVAGNGIPNYVCCSAPNGPALSASLMVGGFYFTAVDNSGNLYISETDGNRVRKVSPDGNISTVVGARPRGFSGDGGPASAAQIASVGGVAIDDSGAVYFADKGNSRIRRISPDGIITTVAGNGDPGNNSDGDPATSAAIGFPLGVTVDGAGNLYFTVEGYNRIRKVSTDGRISTVAGSGPYGDGSYSGDRGPALSATFARPTGIAVDPKGNLYIADFGNHRIRKVDSDGIVTTVAGDGNSGFAGDGGPAALSRLSYPTDVAIDAEGSLYISDRGNHSIRVVRGTDLLPVNSFSIPAAGAASLRTAGTSSATTVGYARVQTVNGSSTPVGVAIFALRQNNVLISETSVPASPLIRSGRLYAQLTGTVNTGVAIANVNDAPAEISFYFTGPNGDFGFRSTSIGPKSQVSAFLNEGLFGGIAPFEGSFTFTSSVPVAVTALRGLVNERGEFLMTTLPVIEVPAAASTSSVSIPHFVAGGGWTTQIVMVNPTDLPIAGTLEFRNQSGGLAPVTIDGETNTSFPYSLPPRSGRRFATSDAGDIVAIGSVRLLPAAGETVPAASVVFSFRAHAVTVSESGVPVIPTSSLFTLYAEMSGNFANGAPGSIQTGIAIHNPSTTPIVVYLGTETVVIPAFGQVAKFLNEISGFSNITAPFQGSIRLHSASAFSIVGLRGRYNERGEFLVTTLPAVGDGTITDTGEVVFPHFAEGAGYTTQFILIARSSSQFSSGILTLFAQSGETMPLTLK